MFKLTPLFAFVLFAVASQALAAITFAGNVTLSASSKTDWQYRATALTWVPAAATAYFTSESIDRTQGSITGDLIIGGVRPGGVGLLVSRFPGAFLAYWGEKINVTHTENIFEIDVSNAGGFVANTYYGIVERNADGVDVAAARFNALSWSLTDSSYQTASPLKYLTLSATVKTTGTVSITHAIANHAGVLSLAGAVITPKVLETIIEIDNWPYLSSNNTLTLVVSAATGSGSTQKNLLVSGDGANKVYFQVNGTAVIGGTAKSVSISTTVSANADGISDNDLEAALSSKYNGNINAQQFNITFTAGAESIIYDPTMGSGDPVSTEESSTSAASVVKAAVIFVLASVVVALL